jgi:hypothetical protein
MSALPPKADIAERDRHVRLCQMQTLNHLHSIALMARADTVGGTSKPKGFGGFEIQDYVYVAGRRRVVISLLSCLYPGGRVPDGNQ